MAVINLYSRSIADGNRKIDYSIEKQLPGDPVSSELCSTVTESVINQFESVRNIYNSKCEKPIADMVQSFTAKESRTISPDILNKIGHEVATKMFPGHQILVVTHLDRDHYHNHIIMNRHHTETGKLSRDSMATVKNLRSINDQVCLAHGLSVPNQSKEERLAKIPKSVALMIKHGRDSYIADMMQKADYARSLATNYNQYQAILSEFGVQARIEKKNISYTYQGQKHSKRGKEMGRLYDKPGLEHSFKANDERFQKNPKVKTLLMEGAIKAHKNPSALRSIAEELAAATDGHFVSGVKDYSKHKVVPRREARWARASEEELTEIRVPIDEMRKARRVNIINYCHDNKIKVETNKNGAFVLKGSPYVELSEYEWRNKKNNTRGTLIDLVAAHKKMSFLEAIAEINGNKRLLLLQNEIGKVKRTYTSFYVSSKDRDLSKNGAALLNDLLAHHGVKQATSEKLIQTEQFHVSKNGLIRIFGQDDEHSTFEYSKDQDGKWQQTKRGNFTNAFYSKPGTGRKATLFLDPFSYMSSQGKSAMSHKGGDPILALMEPNEHVVDQFLNGQRNIDTLRIASANPAKPTKTELDFFGNLAGRYKSQGISIEFMSLSKTISRPGLSLEL